MRWIVASLCVSSALVMAAMLYRDQTTVAEEPVAPKARQVTAIPASEAIVLGDRVRPGKEEKEDKEDEGDLAPSGIDPIPTRLDRHDLEAGLSQVTPLIAACALGAEENGIIETKLQIAPSGAVERVEVPESSRSECLKQAFARASFPHFHGAAGSIEWRYQVALKSAAPEVR